MIPRHLWWRADRLAEVRVTSQAKVYSPRLISLLVKLPYYGQGVKRRCLWLSKAISAAATKPDYSCTSHSSVSTASSTSPRSSFSSGLSTCDIDLHAKQKDRKGEGQQPNQQTTAPSSGCVVSVDKTWSKSMLHIVILSRATWDVMTKLKCTHHEIKYLALQDTQHKNICT